MRVAKPIQHRRSGILRMIAVVDLPQAYVIGAIRTMRISGIRSNSIIAPAAFGSRNCDRHWNSGVRKSRYMSEIRDLVAIKE